jgi:hypothetical protein
MAQPIEDVTCPIYELSDGSIPDPVGSGVLLRLADAVIVLTARHVLAERCGSKMLAGLGARMVQLKGKVLDTAGDRKHDPFDLAVCFLDCSGEGVPAVQPAQLCVASTFEQSPHLLTGYPSSRQPTSICSTVLVQPVTLACKSLAASECGAAGYDPRSSILLGFDRERVWRNGLRLRAPDPHGMSGGGLWAVRDIFGSLLPTPKLVGIAIEWHERDRRILATRIRPALELVAREAPDQASCLSHFLEPR